MCFSEILATTVRESKFSSYWKMTLMPIMSARPYCGERLRSTQDAERLSLPGESQALLPVPCASLVRMRAWSEQNPSARPFPVPPVDDRGRVLRGRRRHGTAFRCAARVSARYMSSAAGRGAAALSFWAAPRSNQRWRRERPRDRRHLATVTSTRRRSASVPTTWSISSPATRAAEPLPVFDLLHGMPGKPVAFTVNANVEVKLEQLDPPGSDQPMILVFRTAASTATRPRDSGVGEHPVGQRRGLRHRRRPRRRPAVRHAARPTGPGDRGLSAERIRAIQRRPPPGREFGLMSIVVGTSWRPTMACSPMLTVKL